MGALSRFKMLEEQQRMLKLSNAPELKTTEKIEIDTIIKPLERALTQF